MGRAAVAESSGQGLASSDREQHSIRSERARWRGAHQQAHEHDAGEHRPPPSDAGSNQLAIQVL